MRDKIRKQYLQQDKNRDTNGADQKQRQDRGRSAVLHPTSVKRKSKQKLG